MLALTVAVFIINLDARVVAPLLPTVAADLRITIAQAGLLVSSYMVPYGLFQIAYGPLSDRYGKLRVCVWAMLVFSIGTALCGVRGSLGTIVAFRVLTGATAAAIFPLALAYIGDTVPYARRQQTIATLMASAGAAQAFSTSAGGLVADLVSWRTVFPIIGALGGVVTAALAWQERGTRVARPDAREPRLRYREILADPRFRALLVLVAAEGFLFIGGFSFLSGLLEERFRYGPFAVGLVMSLAGLSQLAGARLVRRFAARMGERALVSIGGLMMGAAFVLSAFAPGPWWVALACLLVGFGFTLCHSTLQTRATEAFPRGRGSAVAVFAFALFLGSGAGATAFGAAIQATGYTLTFAVAGGWLLILTAAAARFVGVRPTASADS